MNTATTALLDQAGAAVNHSLRSLAHLAHRLNGTLGHSEPGPISTHILERLHTGLTRGTTGFCTHLSSTAPQPAFWVPWAAGKIRCAPCADRAYQRIKNTREDRKCDRCRRTMVTTNTLGWQLPAVILTLPSGHARSLPPVQVHFALCTPCRQLDRPAA
ncbi:hypothetical protein AB0K21_37865 [Streptosporangium sp. NPDC049248]|uniref:hypothetical protein n=1 Tax=Streptosporangium sp. NPDC049248 TaxID=3155651 RepID=UPI00341F6D03